MFNAKLAPKFIGPLEVRRIISPVIVDLRDARGKWYRHVHVKDLKPATDSNTDKGDDPETENDAVDSESADGNINTDEVNNPGTESETDDDNA